MNCIYIQNLKSPEHHIAYSAKVTLRGILYVFIRTRILFDAVIRTKFIYFVRSTEKNISEKETEIFIPLLHSLEIKLDIFKEVWKSILN